ncbi:MAG: gliding motility-associated C-terminal domain-containing protein, partial [Ekhidna sp.]|nr:gliding motility-associated C-terminal domain-containing protein [Ekhidna sp.]
APFLVRGQLYIPETGLIHINEGARLEVNADLANNGVLQNNGTLALYGNWTINNNYNGITGVLELLGDGNQVLNTGPTAELMFRELNIDQFGEVQFNGAKYTVLERLSLNNGIIKTGENTKFILEAGVNPGPGSATSYFDGTLTALGGGEGKLFPLGNDGVYGPLTLTNVFGANQEIAARYIRNNEVDPIPGDSLLGVSNKGYWELEMVQGTTDPTKLEITFNEEDLRNFTLINNIRHRVNSPVISYSNDPGGIFQTLGVESLLNSDSTTFGSIVSESPLRLTEGEKYILAMALAPRVPDEGLYFIPEAFSPRASDPENQRFRVFGEQIKNEGFSLIIYNRFGSVVYTADSFEEANRNGWDGENQRTGADEPAGVYYYTVKFEFETGLPIQKKGAFYLVK